MKITRIFKILALFLAFLPVVGMVPNAFADCDSACCGSTACHPGYKPTMPERCHLIDIFVEAIKSDTCDMNKLPTVEGTEGACLTVSRAERPAQGAYAVLSFDIMPLSNLSKGPVRSPLNLSRAAPEFLYLQNLTLLI